MDVKPASHERAMIEVAERQHGVLSIAQLRRAGVSDDAVRGRLAAGRLHRIHRGVYAVGHGRLSPQGRWMAAVLAVGRGPAGHGASVLGYGPESAFTDHALFPGPM